jgi:hypothetical protein
MTLRLAPAASFDGTNLAVELLSAKLPNETGCQ